MQRHGGLRKHHVFWGGGVHQEKLPARWVWTLPDMERTELGPLRIRDVKFRVTHCVFGKENPLFMCRMDSGVGAMEAGWSQRRCNNWAGESCAGRLGDVCQMEHKGTTH